MLDIDGFEHRVEDHQLSKITVEVPLVEDAVLADDFREVIATLVGAVDCAICTPSTYNAATFCAWL